MRRSLFITFILGASLSCGGESAVAQSPSSIKLRCPNPYGSIYGQVFVTSSGNINYTPCPTDSSIFFGGVDFSNATVTGLPFIASPLTTKGDLWGFSTLNARVPVGANGTVLAANSLAPLGVNYQTLAGLGGVTGTGTTNFVPRWTNGAGGVIGNTPFSWNNTEYVWNNTALNGVFLMNLTPSLVAGVFTVGDISGAANNFLKVDQSNNSASLVATSTRLNLDGTASTVELQAVGTSKVFLDANVSSIGDTSNNSNGTQLIISDPTSTATINAAAFIDANSKAGIFSAGDTAGVFNNTKISVNDSAFTVILGQSASGLTSTGDTTDTTTIGDFLNTGNSTKIEIDDANQLTTFNTFGTSNINAQFDKGAGKFTVQETNGGDTLFTVEGATNSISANVRNGIFMAGELGNANLLTVDDTTGIITLFSSASIALTSLSYELFRTITAGGTTGAQVINKPAGTVNFAGGAAALTVTNSTVTANSIIQITARTNDATCYVKNYVPAAGSFVINMVAACTAETSVGFIVTN